MYINILSADFLIANIALIKLSMSQNGTYNVNQTAQIHLSAVSILSGKYARNNIAMIKFTALKYTYTGYHRMYLSKVGINLTQ